MKATLFSFFRLFTQPNNTHLRLPLSVALLSLVYLCFVLFELIFEPTTPAFTAEAFTQTNEQVVQLEEPPDFTQISAWHLFGQAPPTSTSGQTEEITPTRLQLKLLGIFWLTHAITNAYAIIQSDDGTQKKYLPGDALPGGAVLMRILPYQVVLLNQSRQESLSLEKHNAGALTATE